MKYSNSLALKQINGGDALAVQKERCPHCHQPLSVPPPRKPKNKH